MRLIFAIANRPVVLESISYNPDAFNVFFAIPSENWHMDDNGNRIGYIHADAHYGHVEATTQFNRIRRTFGNVTDALEFIVENYGPCEHGDCYGPNSSYNEINWTCDDCGAESNGEDFEDISFHSEFGSLYFPVWAEGPRMANGHFFHIAPEEI